MENEQIRFTADDEWLVVDLYRFLHSLNVFYNRLYVLNSYIEEDHSRLIYLLKDSLYYVEKDEALIVDTLIIQSPAEINLRGIGEIIKEIREFVKDITYRNKLDKRERELIVSKHEHDLEIKEIKLIEAKIELLKRLEYSSEDIKNIAILLTSPAKKIIKSISGKNFKVIGNTEEDN